MAKEEEVEFIDPKEERAESKRASFKDLIDGSILTRQIIVNQLPYILFLSFMAAIYIGNRYHAEKVFHDMAKLQQVVNDLRAEAITSESELMFISKQSEVARAVKEAHLDLEESVTPPIKIKK